MPQIRFGLVALIFMLGAFTTPLNAAQVQEFVLDNGLKVLLLEDHKSPAVTFQVWYRVGARNEKDGKSGLAHFLEHMMFKGTPTTGPEEYSRIIAKNGGRSNAFTSSDVTVYFATMSREKIGIEVELEADRMANALLGEKYFEPEKKVIQEERRLRTEDNPSSALSEVASAVAYTLHPYRRPVVGRVAMDQFIVSVGGGDFAYLQCYDLTAWNSGFGEHPRGTSGIDQFIGEPGMIERGHGSAFIRAFVDQRLRSGAPRMVSDPDPENGRAVRAYEKAGFEKAGMVDTPDGPALLMVRNA